MGLLDRFRKEEKLYIDPETKETRWIPIEQIRNKPEKGEIVELTREEQMEPKRVHPWQTSRGKRIIKSVGSGVKRVDKAIVSYNRRQPVARRPSYSTQDNYNPFGSMFDTGMSYKPISFDPVMNYNRPSHKKKKSSRSKVRYTVVGDKAYPIVGTGKKKKKSTKKSRVRNPFTGFNPVGNKWRF